MEAVSSSSSSSSASNGSEVCSDDQSNVIIELIAVLILADGNKCIDIDTLSAAIYNLNSILGKKRALIVSFFRQCLRGPSSKEQFADRVSERVSVNQIHHILESCTTWRAEPHIKEGRTALLR